MKRTLEISSAEEISAELLKVAAAGEDLGEVPDLPDLPDLPDSRSLKNTGTGMSVVRACDEAEPDPMEYRVASLLPMGHLSGLFGDGGSGKSYFALFVAFCTAIGQALFGRASMKTNVLFIDFELEKSEFLRRAYRVARGMGFATVPEGINYVQCRRPLTDEATLTACIDIAQNVEAGLVIIDSFAPASCASDQVSPAEIIPFMQGLRRLGTVLLLDHVAKPIAGSSTPLRAYGSTYKHNLVRSSLRLERGDAGGMRLMQMKHNFGPIAEPVNFAMTHTFEAVRFEQIGQGDARLAGLAERAQSVPDRIVAELAQFGPDGTTAARLAELVGCTAKTVSNHLSTLRQSGRVVPSMHGHWRLPDDIGNLPGKGIGP